MLKLEETVFDFPVAPRATNVLDDEEISRHDVVTLTTQQAVKWGRMKYMILSLPDDPYWKNVIAISSLINFFLGTTCFFFAREYNKNFIPIYVICDLLYWTNVILLSLHRYWKKLREKIFTVHVSKLSYTLDLISLLPQEFLVIAVFGDEFGVAVYLRWITYIRLKYLAIYFSVLKELLENRWKQTLVAFLICSSVVAHMTTCIFYEMSCHHQRCSKSGMEQQDEDISKIWFIGEWSQSIVEMYPYYKTAGTFEWYILCFYISLEYLLNVGTGLHRAASLQEMILFSILMMFGYIFFKVWMLYSCFELLVVGRRSEAHYNHKVACIKLYLKDVNITKRAMRNITEYFNILWNKKEGLKSAEHFYSLPTPLQMEITYDLNCVHLNHSLLLYDLKEFYLRTISLFMKHEFLLPGDILYYQGVVKTHLVIIIKGVLEILSDEDDESTILAFQAGTVLGEACLFLSLPAKATVRAAVYTEVKLISRVDFTRNISNYPIAFSYLRERIIFRIRTMKNQIAKNLARRSREGDINEDNLIPIKVIKDHLTWRKNIKDGLKKGASLVSTKEKKPENLSKICMQLLTLYKLSDEDSNVEKPVVCLNYRFPFILDSTSSFVKCWEYFIVVLHFTAIMLYTYEFVFLRKLHVITLTLLICSNAASIIDVLVLTCTTVVFKDRVLQTFGEIIGHRIKSFAFYVYILSVLPISYIIEITLSSIGVVLHRRISDFLITINCLRMVRCISILSATNYHNKNALSCIAFMVFCMTLASYFVACLYYLYSCFDVICAENSWFAILVNEEVRDKLMVPFYEDIVSTSFYLATNIWIRVGVGDITLGLPTDIYLLICTLIIGLIIITYLMSSLAATLAILNSKSELYEQQVFSFQRFLEHSKVPLEMREQVNTHFALEWAYDGSIGRNEFKKMAPEHLQMVVFRTNLMKLLNKVPLFQLVDVDFLMHVVLSSTITILPRNATICYAGDVDREMFIIQKGTCEVFDSAGVFIRDMTNGDSYGDIEMLFNMTKSATIRTITNCKIMVVTFRDFNSALGMFPTEMRMAHKFMYDSDFWRIVDIIEQKRMISFMQMKTSEAKKKKMWSEIRKKFRRSFICAANCYKRSKKRELYWDPFRKMGKWQIIGILFMPVTIHPNGLVLKLWIALRISLLLAMGFCIPRSIGVPPNKHSIMRATIIITEISAYLEIYLFFHIAYYNKKGLLISHPKLTARNYLTHNFVMDFVAAFPYYSIIQYIEPDHRDNLDPTIAHLVSHESYCMWRCMALLQFYRVIGFLNYIQTNVLLKKNVLIFAVIFVSVIAFLFMLSTIVIPDCEFVFVVLEYGQEVDPTIYSIQIYDEAVGLYYIGYLTCKEESWPRSDQDYCPKSPYYLIYCAFNWFIDIFCHMGTKEIEPYSQTDIKSNIILIFLGTIWTTYIIVFSSKATGLSSATSVDYQQKVKELMKFLYKENVSPVKCNKIYRYFEYVWKRTTGMENRKMLDDLNSALKGDIALFLYEKTLRDVAIFRKIARPYLRVIAKNLKEEYFLKSDNLIRCYDVHNSIYIIMRGKVNVLTAYDELVETIGVGGLFGNIHQASPGCSSSTFVAQRNVDALKMTSETFFLLAQEYPAINDVLFSVLNVTGDFILPAHQFKDQSSRFSGLYSEAASEYEEDVYTQDIDITSDYGNVPYYEEEIIEMEETKEEKEEKSNEMETEKKNIAAVRETRRYLVIPKNTFFVLLLFLRPKYWFKFALEPNHRFFEWVRYATFMATSYQLFIIPYVCVSQNFNQYLILPSYLMEPIYYLRIFFFMHEAYLDIYGTYEKRFKLIAKKYFKDYKRMFWDVAPNLPIYLFCFIAEPEKQIMTYTFLRLYQLLRIKYIYEAFALWSAPLLAKRARLLFYKMLFTFLLAIHYLLLLYLLVQLFHKEITLATRDFVRDGGHLEAYMFYLYISCNLLSTTAMGDYVSHTITEAYLSLFGTAFTKIIFALLIAFFSKISIMLLQHLLNYEYKVNELIKFLANQGLSDHLKEKLWIYVKQLWKTQYGVHIPVLLENAPYVLKCEIMREVYSVHLSDGYLFRDINEALLRQICGHLKRIVFFRGNYIVQNGDTNASMYWIHRGEVSVLTVHPNLTETCHDILHVHDMFGLAQGLNYGMPHRYSYRAETQCDILVLKLEVWESVLQQFPNDKDIIYKRMFNLYTIL